MTSHKKAIENASKDRNRRTVSTDRLFEDKVYLAVLEQSLPPRVDLEEDMVQQTVCSTAGETLNFLKRREKFWDQIEIGGLHI